MRTPNKWNWTVGAKLKGGDRITERTLGIVPGAVPDGDDAATRGCLLEQVREMWWDPCAFVVPMWKRWRVTVHTAAGRRYYFGPTEWDALSFALDGSGDVAQTDMLPDWKTRAFAAEKKLKTLTAKKASLWILASKQKPPVGVQVLAQHVTVCREREEDTHAVRERQSGQMTLMSHWMPLPPVLESKGAARAEARRLCGVGNG